MTEKHLIYIIIFDFSVKPWYAFGSNAKGRFLMNHESLQKAIMLLNNTDSTCVFCSDDTILTDKRRGVRPLLDLLDSDADVAGFSVADKVVGKAAAFLYCLLKVKEIYARVISQPALVVLEQAGIKTTYGQLVPAIKNRTKDGFCPMERAVLDISSPSDALSAIQKTLNELSK